MNKAKKKKQVAADPLQEAPNPMCPCEPAAPPVETFDERVVKATRSMSPEKTRVTRLCMEYDERIQICVLICRRKRACYQEAKQLKRAMRDIRAVQNLVPKARTLPKSNWLSGRQTKSDWLRSEKSTTHVFQNG